MDDSSELETEKRAIIRNNLYDYGLKYMTYDHDFYTKSYFQTTLSSCLQEVPLHDPKALSLPKDPLQDVYKIFGTEGLDPFEECWAANANTLTALTYLKSKLAWSKEGSRIDERFFEFEGEPSLSLRPLSPAILTRKAVRQTPKICQAFPRTSTDPSSTIIQSCNLRLAPIDNSYKPKMPSNEEVLCLRPTVPLGIVKTLETALSTHDTGIESKHTKEFLRCNSPLFSVATPAMFVPIFPRKQKCWQTQPVTPASISGLPAMIPQVNMSDNDEDLDHAHLVLVGGWEAYSSSPCVTPTPNFSEDNDNIDQLFDTSSPGTEVTTVDQFLEEKLEICEVPRSRRWGHKTDLLNQSGEQSLAAFILPKISEPKACQKLISARPSSPPPESLVGQASSNCRDSGENATDHDFKDGSDSDLRELYAAVKDEDIFPGESLDEKDAMLMKVPNLPPPNVYQKGEVTAPGNLKSLVASTKQKGELKDVQTSLCFLRRVKGIKALNLELSWIPTKPGAQLPAVEEVVDVQQIDQYYTLKSSKEGFANLLVQIEKPYAHENGTQWVDSYRGYESMSFGGTSAMIHTRRERRRMRGLAEDDGSSEIDKDATNLGNADMDMNLSRREGNPERPNKRAKVISESGCQIFVDDSGIALQSWDGDTIDHGGLSSQSSLHSFGLDFENDKENIPPPVNTNLLSITSGPEFEQLQCDMDAAQTKYCIGDPMATAEVDSALDDSSLALSFDSGLNELTTQSQPFTVNAATKQFSINLGNSKFINEEIETTTDKESEQRELLSVRSSPLFPTMGVLGFAALRARTLKPPTQDNTDTTLPASLLVPEPPTVYVAPQEIHDQNTIRLPSAWAPPSSRHQYLASLDVIQKQAIVRSLRSDLCAVDLFERDTLNGVDLILHPHAAVIFFNIFSLHSQGDSLLAKLCEQSWRYSRILVVFEAFSRLRAFRDKRGEGSISELNAYTPPIIKALKKLKRDLGIADGLDNKCSSTRVLFAYANDAQEAAIYVRHFGNYLESIDERGDVLWGDRLWLPEDRFEGETMLSLAQGMNALAACVILSQISWTGLLELSHEERLEMFGPYLGDKMLTLLNADIVANPEITETVTSLGSGFRSD